MNDFGNILNRGKKMFGMKNKKLKWGRCEECDQMRQLLSYIDSEDQEWFFCEECAEVYVKDDEEYKKKK